MIEARKIAFDNISRTLAITRYDIEQHQSINDQSLNIHSENWFRDIFNFIYNAQFVNANFDTRTGNSLAIDLLDKHQKIAYQITTTRTKEKVDDTFKKMQATTYKEYTLKILFLLDKAQFKQVTKQYFQDIHGINIEDHLLDYTDLLKDIEALESDRLVTLNERFFLNISERYTDNMVLDLVFKHLLKKRKKVIVDYRNDDFGSIDTVSKLVINGINQRISAKIKESLDYRVVLDDLCGTDHLIVDLKSYIVDDIYKNILLEYLGQKISKKELLNKKTSELQDIATSYHIDFNSLIDALHQKIENTLEINDFNTMHISWIIIAYFFELCDIGVDKRC